MQEKKVDYEKRKKDHIFLSLKTQNQGGETGLSHIALIHEALPEIDFSDVSISTTVFRKKMRTPFFVAAMTGGFQEAKRINFTIAKACHQRGWMMGVGSQRKGLSLPDAKKEWREIKQSFPHLCVFGNLGLSQLIGTSLEQMEELVHILGASAMMIHTNALQECIQPEGTPQFKGGIKALSFLVQNLSVPVCLKETGCGFSYSTLKKIQHLNLYAVDISGYGGTHWGRIEGDRAHPESINYKASQTFSCWGESTLSSLLSAQKLKRKKWNTWASGGLKNGLDAAKCFALGATGAGWANLILKQALKDDKALDHQMSLLEHELKIALFCTGSKNIDELKNHQKWRWI